MNADGLLFVLCLTGFFVIFYGPWQWACTDFARQVIFEQRDQIFDIAAHGGMDFRSNEYQDIRESLNYLIRFCHELTLPNLLYYAMTATKASQHAGQSTVLHTVESIRDPLVKREVQKCVLKAYRAAILMLLAKSLIAPAALLGVAACIAAARYFTKVRDQAAAVVLAMGEMIQVNAEYAMAPAPRRYGGR